MGLSLEFIYTPPMLEDHSRRWIVMMQLAIGSCITVLLQNLVAVPLPPHDPSVTHLRSMIDRYALDLGNLERFYKIPFSETTFSRLDEFHHSYESMLESLDFDQLDQNSKVDYHLLRTHLKFERRQIVHDRQLAKEAIQLAPWIQTLIPLIEARQRVDAIDPPAIADALHALNGSIQQTLETWRKMDKKTIPPIVANRTSRYVDQLGRHLEEWDGFYNGYHPVFSWWVAKSSEKVRESMKSSAQWLRTEIAGYREGDDAPLLGDPIGRDALLDALRREWIPYSPLELIAIARMEMEWCLNERKKASRKMGFGEDWQAAQNHVKSLHVDAGEQPQLIKRLAREAEEFLDERDLITIPAIARETWRMEMMSPERQKVNPYFTGGEVISVSFPTAEMEHDHKLMSLRGNNVHFSKATVHHELIPGHHLQLFMAERYNTHRKIFRTPFLIEGWALYWEMLLWDLEFADSPEDRIGMLFWRSHRCARIIFSLSFHLGLMSPQECIDYLVQEVGHEVRNATAEVRRSIQGGYSPLYQAAYMLGGLQLRQLRHEMIHSHQWTDKQFHDAVLIENSIPIELIRASLTGMPVDRDWKSQWRFYPGLPASPETNPSKPKVNPAEKSPAKAYKATVDPHWFGNDSRFWYRNEVADGQFEFILVDAVEGRRVPAFDHAQVARQLTALTGETCSEYQLPFESIEFNPENPSIRLLGRQKSWLFDPQNGQVSELKVRASSGLTKYNEPIASRDGSTQTEIEFINKLNQRVSIHWIDSDLEERHYQDIEAGKSVFQNTYSGHAWAVRGESGDFIGTYIAGSKNGQAVIDDSPGEKRQPRRRSRRNATPEEMAAMGSISPDGQWKAFVQDHNLHVQNLKNNQVHPLTSDATIQNSYQQNGQREKFMGMQYDFEGYPEWMPKSFWSPDSKYILAIQSKPAPERLVHMVQSSPEDALQPTLHTIPYFKPGDPIPVDSPHLFSLESLAEIPVDNSLFPAPWSLENFQWMPDSSEILFVYNQRGHQVMRVIGIQTPTAHTRILINEECATFFDYAGKYYFEFFPETHEAIWMSERDGWNHLFLYDTKTGEVKNQITRGNFPVFSVFEVDSQHRTLIVTAGGINAGEDPYHQHFYRVNWDGSGWHPLTFGDGTHEITKSPDANYYIDRWSRVDSAPVHELRKFKDGSLICQLESGDISSFILNGKRLPQRFAAPGRDGKTDIYGIIHWPENYHPDKKYPVIENIYAGPHSAHVPKSFRNSYRQQEIANLGAIVVQIDGMGTSHRSKAFHDVCWKNIVDAGFPDRIAWMEAAAEEFPQFDLTRVGIYGGSAGGQNALGALLTQGDFYKAAVADCGCHDNRMDKIWWNELWMGYPIGEHYAQQSNVSLASNLQGNLLLMVGELDKNVDPASTMQVAHQLIQAEKDFELLVLPNVGHGAAGTPYGWNKLKSFFKTHLIHPSHTPK